MIFEFFRRCWRRSNRVLCIVAILSILCSFLLEVCIEVFKPREDVGYVPEASDINFPIVLWWTPFSRPRDEVRKCFSKKCLFTQNRAFQNLKFPRAFLFYGTDLNLKDLPLRETKDAWALLHEESLKNAPSLFNKYFLSLFNYTSTFSRFSHLPLSTQHLKHLSDITDLKYYVPTSEKNKLLGSIAPVLYIQSNCDTLTDRDAYVAKLKEYIHVDSYGKCLNNAKLPDGLDDVTSASSEDFLHFVSKYKFTIAIENAVCNDYITEKLWRPLIVGSVPLYFGSPSVQDWLPNYDSAILISDFHSPQELAVFVAELNQDDDRYERFLQHKVERKISNPLLKGVLRSRRWYLYEHVVQMFECQICVGLYEGFPLAKEVDETHLNCEHPASILTNSRNETNHWNSILRTGSCQGRAIFEFMSRNATFAWSDVEELTAELMIEGEC